MFLCVKNLIILLSAPESQGTKRHLKLQIQQKKEDYKSFYNGIKINRH